MAENEKNLGKNKEVKKAFQNRFGFGLGREMYKYCYEAPSEENIKNLAEGILKVLESKDRIKRLKGIEALLIFAEQRDNQVRYNFTERIDGITNRINGLVDFINTHSHSGLRKFGH